jgi:hypothetical protein
VYGKTSSSRARKSGSQGASYSASQYRTVSNTLAKRIDSYKTLMTQTQAGSGKFGRPSPSTLNSFANWVNKGAVVQMISSAQISRWARAQGLRFNAQSPSTAACKNVLCHKFSRSLIKAVAMTKNGQFMVATSATYNGRPFAFPR